MTQRDAPRTLRSLTERIRNSARARGAAEKRLQWVIANTVVGQMLPNGVVKGGTSIKVRVGEAGSRFTPDLDAVREGDVTVDDYIASFGDLLERGWGLFSGVVVRRPPANPPDVPVDYVMQPFDVRLSYRNSHWITVKLELGHDEIGGTGSPEFRMSSDISGLFAEIGLPEPLPIPLLSVEHQIAQKIHACTLPSQEGWTNERAHDLVDIQILRHEEPVDERLLGQIAPRLFAARQAHAWPPTVAPGDSWQELYTEAARGLNVEQDMTVAIADLNEWIAGVADEG
jgi:hypothetical protein